MHWYRLFALLAVLPVSSGCLAHLQAKYEPFYTRETPRYYDATEDPLMFQYSVEDATWTIEQWFAPMLLIGHLDFNGPPPSPRDFYRYGRSVGAEVIVVGATKTEEKTIETTRTVYGTSTSTVYDSQGKAVGRVQTSTPHEEPYTYTISRYDFVVSFFRHKPEEVPWWDLREDMIKLVPPKKNGLDGAWSDGDYLVRLLSTKDSYLGFVEAISEKKLDEVKDRARKDTGARRQWWTAGDLKLMVEKGDMDGIWMMANKAPIPCKFRVEKKTGYLLGDCADGATRRLERVPE